MADLKISQLNSLPGSSLANSDVLAVVDVSASETKKITSVELVRYGYGLISSGTLDGDIIEAGTTSARGTIQLTDATDSTSTTTASTPNAVKSAYDLANAALPAAGGTISGNLTVSGDLTVSGTTTTIDTTTLVVEDKNIELGNVDTPTDVTADGGGITLKGTTDKTINWVDATDAWTFSEHINLASGKEFYIDGNGVLNATTLGSGVVNSSLTSVGTIATGTWEGTAIDAAYLDSTVVTTSDTGTVTSTMILDGTIVNADVNASAAIAGTKIDPDFGSQTVETTGVINAGSGTEGAPSVSVGTTNNGLYSPDTNEVAISTNGTGRLFVDASGNVLINSSAARANTFNSTISQVLQIEGITSDTRGIAVFSSATSSGADGYLVLGHQKSGSIGGNTALSANDSLGTISFQGNTGSTFFQGAKITAIVDSAPSGSDMPSALVFFTADTAAASATERLRITSDGKLGLGTSSPGGTLDVTGTSGTYPTQQIRHSNADTDGEFLRIARTDLPAFRYHSLHASHGGATNYLQFKIHDPSVSTTAQKTVLHLAGSGNVGIGTTSPDTTLHVNSGTVDLAAHFESNDSNVRIKLSDGDATNAVFVAGKGDNLAFETAGNNERMRIDSSGRLLVGTSSWAGGDAAFVIKGRPGSGPGIQYLSYALPASNILNNTTLGYLYFSGRDGEQGAFISAVSDDNWAASDYPTRLVFSTTADGAASPTERMRITSSGNVGIGTTSPASILEVRDSLATGITSRSTNTQSTNTNKALKVRNNSDTDTFNVSYKGQGYFADSVGIGTTSPNGKLHVESAATTAGWQIRTDSVGLNNESGFYRDASDNYELVLRNGSGGLSYLKNNGGASTANLVFNVQGSERARIENNGRLLVGTSTSVATGSSTAGLQLHNTTTANGAFLSVARFANDTTGGKLAICKSRNSTVAVGTIVQSGDTVGTIEFAADDGTDLSTRAAEISAYVDGTPGANDMPGRLVFSVTADGSASPTEAMRINNAGELLVGYTSDNGAYKLQVNSQIFATSATIATSDGRYKENVAPLNGSLDLVKALRPVSFTWKPQEDITRLDEEGNEVLVREGHNFPEGTQVGFIAQEVQEVLDGKPWLNSVIKENVRPAVKDNDGNELAPEEQFYGIAEGNLIAVLTNALQEAVGRIETLEAEVAALKS